MKKLSSVVVAVVAASQSFAVEPQQIDEEIIITATRTNIPVSSALTPADVITASDIERLQPVDFPDLLRHLPSVDITQNGGRGSNATIRMRGTESDQVLILIDGVRSASASNGATAIQHIPLNQIERIEVVKGPRSSLYGAEALGGVIQVFTKKGKNAQAAFSPSVRFEYGSHNTRATDFNVSGSTSNTYYSVALSHEESDGINRTVGGVAADVDSDGYTESAASLSLGHTFGNGVNLEGSYLRSEGNTEFDSGSDDILDSTDFINEAASIRFIAPFNDALTVTVNLGYAKDETDNFGSFPSLFDTTRDSASLQLDYQISEGQTLTAGYDYYNDQLDSTSGFVEEERDNTAFFAQYLGQFDVISVQAGLRADDNEAYGSETTGTAAVGYEISDSLVASLSYGTAFKAPTFNDLYFPFTDFGFGFTFEGNPGLSPESSESWELLLQKNTDKLTWSISVYQTEIEDLIELTATSVENISEAEITGMDATLDFVLADWNVGLSLGYLEATDKDTDERLEDRPRTKASLDVSRQFGKFDIGMSMLSQGNRLDSGKRLGGYTLFDVRGSYRFTESLVAGFNIKNLLDKDYTLIDGFSTFRTEGQTASVFLQYNL